MKGITEVAVVGSRGERIAKAKEGLVEMPALDPAERVVGAAARRHR
jgi:hypothetical protein